MTHSEPAIHLMADIDGRMTHFLDEAGHSRLCDGRLENQSTCSEPATHLVADRHGVPWGFCDLHYPLRYYQAPFRMQ